MEMLSVLMAILMTPIKAARGLSRAIFGKLLGASDLVLGAPRVVSAHFARQSITDTYLMSMVMLPKNWNNNTSYGAASFFVDMQEYDFVDFLLQVGAIDQLIDAKVQESVNADGSSPSDVSGAAITQIGTTSDNRMVVVSVRKTTLTKRYVGLAVNVPSGTTNSLATMAVQYGKNGALPVTQSPAGTYTYLTGEVVKV